MTKKAVSESKSQPIGVFDSGMGGLTVLRELVAALPQESFIYLGDTARLPYGTKGAQTVRRYAEQMAIILTQQDIKLLVVACNTATAAALDYLQARFPKLPIVGVIEPGAVAAVCATHNNNIAVLATESTIASKIYDQTFAQLNVKTMVVSQACGLFVALAEEGCLEDEIAMVVVAKYLRPVINSPIKCDCILLGCTHFPVLENLIARFVGEEISIINSAKATASAVASTLKNLNLQTENKQGKIQYLVTDLPERFIRIGQIFLGHEIDANRVQRVEVDIHHAELKYQVLSGSDKGAAYSAG